MLTKSDYSKTLDLLSEGIQIVDFDWRCLYANNILLMHQNISRQELVGHTLMDVYPGIGETALFAVLEKCMDERHSVEIENEVGHPGESGRWFQLKIHPVEEGLLILSTDITERKEIENKINKVNRLYALISQVNQKIVRISTEDALFSNACELALEFGRFKMAWIGIFDEEKKTITLTYECGVPPADKALFMNAVCLPGGPEAHVLRTGTYYVCNDIGSELQLNTWQLFAGKYGIQSCLVLPIRKNKKIIGTFNLYSTQISFNDEEEIALLEELTGDMSFALDLFENKKQQELSRVSQIATEKSLRLSEMRLKEAHVLAHMGDWEIDLLTNTHTWSDEFYSIFGITKNEVAASQESFVGFMHPDDRDYANLQIEESFESHQNSCFNFRFTGKDGELRHGYTEWKFEFDKKGKPIRLFGITQDSTARKTTELQIENQNAELIKINSELDRFVYSVSHDLRSPLASILGLIGFVVEETKEPETLKHMKMIRHSVNRLDGFIKNILSYSRNNRTVLDIAHVPLRKSIDEIVASLRHMPEAESIRFEIVIHEKHPFFSDQLRFDTILENMLSNAIKHHRDDLTHKYIKVSAITDRERLLLRIEDNGPGIDPLYHEKIFDMFFRVSGKVTGSGIGLYVVKQLILNLEGSILIESEPGKGTAFIIRLKNMGNNPVMVAPGQQ